MVQRIFLFGLLVAAKVAAAGQLVVLLLGYLFFLDTHPPLVHLYVAASASALVAALLAGPRLARHVTFVRGFWLVVLVATPLGLWRVWQHLQFFQGPEYGAALFDLAIIGSYWTVALFTRWMRTLEPDVPVGGVGDESVSLSHGRQMHG